MPFHHNTGLLPWGHDLWNGVSIVPDESTVDRHTERHADFSLHFSLFGLQEQQREEEGRLAFFSTQGLINKFLARGVAIYYEAGEWMVGKSFAGQQL